MGTGTSRQEGLQRKTARRSEPVPISPQPLSDSSGEADSDYNSTARLNRLAAQMPARDAAAVLFDAANSLHRRGRWPKAAALMQRVIDRYPNDDLGPAAMSWLVQYHTSAEVALRVGASTKQETQPPAQETQPSTAPGENTAAQDNGPLARIVRRGERMVPALFARPEMRLPLAAASRRADGKPRAERRYGGVRPTARRDRWWGYANAESWLAGPRQGKAPVALARCVRSEHKPYLDGRLDDALWRDVSPMLLRGPACPSPAKVMLAYDEEFLYLAVHCPKAPRVVYSPARTARERDADLSHSDHVEIWLDSDRDYTSGYLISVDHRGFAREVCWGDVSWNPKWYVASASDDRTWTVEAAVPLAELVTRSPQPQDAWSIGARRIVPGAGQQTWIGNARRTAGKSDRGFLIFK